MLEVGKLKGERITVGFAAETRDLIKNAKDKLVSKKMCIRDRRDIVGRTKLIEGLIEQIRERAPRVIEDYRMRLEARLAELLGDTSVDESRIVMEAAFYADRSDITEELVRLGSHSVQIYEVVRQDEPIGRRLEFLVQEMQREVNTIGAKAQDSDISHRVVDIKSELEKIREQIQNIE